MASVRRQNPSILSLSNIQFRTDAYRYLIRTSLSAWKGTMPQQQLRQRTRGRMGVRTLPYVRNTRACVMRSDPIGRGASGTQCRDSLNAGRCDTVTEPSTIESSIEGTSVLWLQQLLQTHVVELNRGIRCRQEKTSDQAITRAGGSSRVIIKRVNY